MMHRTLGFRLRTGGGGGRCQYFLNHVVVTGPKDVCFVYKTIHGFISYHMKSYYK